MWRLQSGSIFFRVFISIYLSIYLSMFTLIYLNPFTLISLSSECSALKMFFLFYESTILKNSSHFFPLSNELSLENVSWSTCKLKWKVVSFSILSNRTHFNSNLIHKKNDKVFFKNLLKLPFWNIWLSINCISLLFFHLLIDIFLLFYRLQIFNPKHFLTLDTVFSWWAGFSKKSDLKRIREYLQG